MTTKTKLKALVWICELKENQISRLTTKKSSLIKSWMKQVLESPNKTKCDGRIFTNIRRQGAQRDLSGCAKNTVKERGNLEVHELLMITDTVQCKSC